MIRVFFENKGYAELVAVFVDEQTYLECLPTLERIAKEQGFENVTEVEENSVQSSKIFDVLKSMSHLPLITEQ